MKHFTIILCIYSVLGSASDSECEDSRVQVRTNNAQRPYISPEDLVLLLHLLRLVYVASHGGLVVYVYGAAITNMRL